MKKYHNSIESKLHLKRLTRIQERLGTASLATRGYFFPVVPHTRRPLVRDYFVSPSSRFSGLDGLTEINTIDLNLVLYTLRTILSCELKIFLPWCKNQYFFPTNSYSLFPNFSRPVDTPASTPDRGQVLTPHLWDDRFKIQAWFDQFCLDISTWLSHH